MNWSPHNWKEARRLQAWELLQRGWSQRQIAEAMGVSEAAVSQWMTRAREPGPAALQPRSPPGVPAACLPTSWPACPRSYTGVPKATAFAARYGPARASPSSCTWHVASGTIRPMAAASSKPFDGVSNSRHAARGNTAKRPWLTGTRTPGRPSTKGPGSSATHLLHRRVRVLSPSERRADVCAGGPYAHLAAVVDP
jgi:hypothetical protein